MALIACYVAANEADVIAESLRSVKGYVDRFVIVDSIFTGNPIDATHSTDETRRVCERICSPIPLTYIESDRKLDEHEARNRYLAEVGIGDWILSMDGDEVLVGDHAAVLSILSALTPPAVLVNVFTTAVIFPGLGIDMPEETYETGALIHTVGPAPKLLYRTEGLHYRRFQAVSGAVDFQGCYDGDHLVGGRFDPRLIVVNRHVAQSHAAYVADCVWEMGQAAPAA